MQRKADSIGKLHRDRNLESVLDMEQGCKRMQTYNTLLTSYHQPPTEFRRLFAKDVENILGLCGNHFLDLLVKFGGVSDFLKSFCNEFEQHLVGGMMDGHIWSFCFCISNIFEEHSIESEVRRVMDCHRWWKFQAASSDGIPSSGNIAARATSAILLFETSFCLPS